ncbi:MAG: cytochrome c family protein [Aestuariivirgaceae bacterium]
MFGFDSFELNKIAGAVLGTLLLTFGLSLLAGFIYTPHRPEKLAFSVAVAEAPAAAPAAGAGETKPIAELLKTASPEKGQTVAKACAACHDLTKANANKVGPGLWNVVDRPIASHPGFAYSDAMKAKSADKWTYDHLNGFLHNPKGYVPGTKMTYAGVTRDDQRADLIAYLRTLADSPQPLPAPQ